MLSSGEFNRIKQLQGQGLTVGQIARQLHLNEKTVRKWSKVQRYECPKPPVRTSILDPYKEKVRMLLHEYADYTATQLFQFICEDGYVGGYTLVREYVNKVRPPKRKEAHGEYNWGPGECAQIDFGACGEIRAGDQLKKVSVFSMVLSWSRMMYLEFIFGESMEYFLACHLNALEFFGSVPRKLRPDCCKVAVIGFETDQSGRKVPIYNPRYLDFAAHYGATLDACEPYSPFQKPGVENGIGYIKKNLLNGLEMENLDLDALNLKGRHWLETIANVRQHRTTNERPLARFPADRAAMIELPPVPYNCAVIRQRNIDKQARFDFDGNRYSVPPLYHNIRINLHILPDKLLAYYKGKLIAKHKRIYEKREKPIVHPDHERSLRKHEQKERTRRLIQQFLRIGPIAETYYEKLCERHLNPDQHVRKIMSLAQMTEPDKLLCALQDSHHNGAYSSDYIHNLLTARRTLQQLTSPLQLQRNNDLLDLDIQSPDLNQYNHYLKGDTQ